MLLAKARGHLLHQLDAAVGERLLALVPAPLGQPVGSVLDEHLHHVPPGRRHRRIHRRGDGALEHRGGRRAPGAGVVVGALDVVDARADVDRPAVLRAGRVARKGGEARQLGEAEVDLQRGARIVDAADRLHHLVREMLGADQPEEGHGRVGVGDHPPGGELRAIPEHHARRSPVLHLDLHHRGIGPDLRARAASGRGDRLAQGPHPALDVPPDAPRPVALPHHVVEEHVGGPRRRRGGHRPDDRVGGERGLELIGLEPPIEDRPRRSGQDLQRPRSVPPQAQEPPSGPGEPEEVSRPAGERIDGGLEERRLDGLGDPLQHRLVGRQPVRVAHRELGHLPVVELRVGSHEERAAVREGSERGRVARKELVAVPSELQVAHDLRAEEAHHVRGGGDPEARPRLLGDGGAADPVARLEHQHLLPRPREVRGSHQTVVAPADDDDVPGLHWAAEKTMDGLRPTDF